MLDANLDEEICLFSQTAQIYTAIICSVCSVMHLFWKTVTSDQISLAILHPRTNFYKTVGVHLMTAWVLTTVWFSFLSFLKTMMSEIYQEEYICERKQKSFLNGATAVTVIQMISQEHVRGFTREKLALSVITRSQHVVQAKKTRTCENKVIPCSL